MPPALLSRFDLLFLLLDKYDEEMDKKLAYHVASVHKFMDVRKEEKKHVIHADIMRAFIAYA